ncbi:MAG: metal ABC transporter permease, partial [Lachnospiraceae bacterium]|nr:metal ABC transporter permease [Lachnospiraceae bacterium]
MAELFEKLGYYLSFPFVRYALIVGTLISLCASLLGVTLVLKRFSFIGDGLSHVAFGAMAVATVLGIANQTVLVMPLTIATAVLLLRRGKNAKVKGDAAIAMFSVGALAIGYLLMNVFNASSNVSGDVCTTLFGSISILTLTSSDVIMSIIFSVAIIALFVIFYNRIFSVTFDEAFAKATGLSASLYNLLIAVIIAVIIVLGMNLVGSLLISALVIFPALSAMRVISSFKGVVICSAVIAVFCALTGMIVSIVTSTPIGSTIVVADLLVYFAFSLI